MFKFGIKEKVVTEKEEQGKKIKGIIRGRAEYQGYNEFHYMVQMPKDGEIDIEDSENNLDFRACTWLSESKLHKL